MAPLVAYLLLSGVALFVLSRRRNSTRSLPPGPPADPLIGHYRIFPSKQQSDVLRGWSSIYGNVLYFDLLGQPVVILNGYDDAINLLEKRSAIYSDKPAMFTTMHLVGLALTGALAYGNKWRMHRRLLQQKLLVKSCLAYQDIEVREARVLLSNLVRTAGDCSPAVERYSAAVVLKIAYGHQVESDDDEMLHLVKLATHVAEKVLQPSHLDYFPFLQHIPHWLPGCSWLTATVRESRPIVRKMYDRCFDTVRTQMKAGTAKSSFVSTYLKQFEGQGSLTNELSEAIKESAATLVMAGYDTTGVTLMTFIQAMLLFPDVQHKAQAEIDRVVGSQRLPTFEDRSSLPYLDCVLREVIRWHPVVTPGLPHCSVEDDIYNGMLIPKGSLVLANAAGMTRDPNLYRDPNRFYPERFLPEPHGYGEKHYSVEFGFGRRICPGRHLAEAAIWIAMATILSALDITNAGREDGEPIVTEAAFTDTIVSRPLPFKCIATPRSDMTKLPVEF